MRLIRQKSAHGYKTEVFRIRVWKKTRYIKGWYAEIRIGQRQWLIAPTDKQGPPRRGVKESQ